MQNRFSEILGRDEGKIYVAEDFDEPMSITYAGYTWLRSFDVEDIRKFLDEFNKAICNAHQGLHAWEDVDAVVERWRNKYLGGLHEGK